MAQVIAEPQSEALAKLFEKSFAVVQADTATLRDELYKLRYQVYCVENQFENPAEHPNGREKDAWDDFSLHAALIHKPYAAVIGGVRLVLPGHGELPIRTVVGREENRRLDALPADGTAEISRYAVSRVFRRRSGEGEYPDVAAHDWSLEEEYRRILPNITLGLMRAILGYCMDRGIEYLCATMSPALLRMLDRFGLHFESLGPRVDFHGSRQPCFAAYRDLLEGLRRHRPDLYEVVLSGFDSRWMAPIRPLPEMSTVVRAPEPAKPARKWVTVVAGEQRLHTAAVVDSMFAPGQPEAAGILEPVAFGALDKALQTSAPKSIWFGDAYEYDLLVENGGPRFRASLRRRAAH